MPRRTTPEPMAETLGARIRKLRKERGMSLSQLSKASDLSKGSLSGIERGLTLITVRTLDKVAKGLGMKATDVLTYPPSNE